MTNQEIKDFCKSVLVKRNPWKLTPRQCLALHLVCVHGSIEAASKATGVKTRTMMWHIREARARRKMAGHDLRIYLLWNGYARSFS